MAISLADRPAVLDDLNAWLATDANTYFCGAGPKPEAAEAKLLSWWGLPTGYHRDHVFKPVFLNSLDEARELIAGNPVKMDQTRLALWFGSRKEATEIARTPRSGKYGIVIRESYSMLNVHVHCSVLARHWRCKSPGDKIVARVKGPLFIHPNKVVTGLRSIEKENSKEGEAIPTKEAA